MKNPKKNPGMGAADKLFKLDTWAHAAHGVAGFSSALVLPASAPALNRGGVGVALSAASTVAASLVAGYLSPKASENVFKGGALAVAIKAGVWLAPSILRRMIPMQSEVPTVVSIGPTVPNVKGIRGYDDGILDNDELLAGEQAHREAGGVSGFLPMQGMGLGDFADPEFTAGMPGANEMFTGSDEKF